MYDLLSALDGFTAYLEEERPSFVTIDFKTRKLDLFTPKVNPKIRAISGPEIMCLEERDKWKERDRR